MEEYNIVHNEIDNAWVLLTYITNCHGIFFASGVDSIEIHRAV